MIDYRDYIDHDNEYHKINRILDLNVDLNEKSIQSYNVNKMNEHREYLLSIIEFLTILSKKYKYKDLLLIMIKNSKNKYILEINELFNELDYLLIESKSMIDIDESMSSKKTITKKMFIQDEDLDKKIKLYNKEDKKLVYISDIIYEKDEENIEQMEYSIRLCKNLNTVGYYIKVNYLLLNNGFLDGSLYIPVYNNINNTNINVIKIMEEGENIKIDNYNVNQIENAFRYQNKINCIKKYKYEKSNLLKENLFGYDDGYESVCEYYIIYEYYMNKYKNKSRSSDNIHQYVINNLYKMNHYYLNILQHHFITSYLLSMMNNKSIKNEYIYIYFIQIVYMLKNQMKYIKNNHFLDSSKNSKQIDIIKDIIDKMCDYINNIGVKNKISKNMYEIVNEYKYYLKYYILESEEVNNMYNDHLHSESSSKSGINVYIENVNETKEYIKGIKIEKYKTKDILKINVPILYLLNKLKELKNKYSLNKVIVDKKDYFFL